MKVVYEVQLFNGTFPHCSLSPDALSAEIANKVDHPPPCGFPFGRRKRNGETLPTPTEGDPPDGRRFIQIEVDANSWIGDDDGKPRSVRQMYLDAELVGDNTVVVVDHTSVF